MKTREVMVARIYLSEQDGRADELMRTLHDDYGIRGVTVFRGISGFGDSRRIHASRLLDLSLDLPIVLEFFDAREKVERCLDGLELAPGHCLTWMARVND